MEDTEKTLDERVMAFKCMELPGQPQMMHMGTSYLVQDLHREVKRLRKTKAEEIKEHFIYGYHFCRANGFLFDEKLQEASEEYIARLAVKESKEESTNESG